MDTKHSDQHYSEQETDLVDLMVVLYRRKVALFLVTVICLVISVVYWSRISEKLTIQMSFQAGRIGTTFIVDPDELTSLLLTLYLPSHVDKKDVDIKNDVSRKNYGGGVVGLLCEVETGARSENFQIAADKAFKDSLKSHNAIYENTQKGKHLLLDVKNQELEAAKMLAKSPDFTAIDLAAQLSTGASITRIQRESDTSFPSEIPDTVTVTPIPSRNSYR